VTTLGNTVLSNPDGVPPSFSAHEVLLSILSLLYRTAISHCPRLAQSGFWLYINLLMPNVNYSGRTAPLTSKVAFCIFIQQIYVLNILNMVYTLRFFSSKCSLFHNSNVFGSSVIHILYTECAKIKKIIPAPKG